MGQDVTLFSTDVCETTSTLPSPRSESTACESIEGEVNGLRFKEWDEHGFKLEEILQCGVDRGGTQLERCFDSVEGRQVVVKRYPQENLNKKGFALRGDCADSSEDPWQEMLLQMQLGQQRPGHVGAPGVLACYGAFRDRQGDALLVMEWCPYSDIFAFASKLGEPGPQRQARALPVLRSLLQVVQNLHRQSVAHCDITAENALLRSHGDELQVVLTNFEMAVQGQLSAVSGSRGKPMYMAPETRTQCFYDGAAADLFSCGVVGYILATGNYPWLTTDGSCRGFTYAQRHGIPRFLHKRYVNIGQNRVSVRDILSPGYYAVLAALLDMNPLKRCDLSGVLSEAEFQC
eukprot:TRINITY_DN66363_c0_g1_i1.p1 TRINITY_DN66363_c0_g1~~TRINITY_DN66363_c0_g1_i1.p1  ORF type:complete len:347 (-),score=51.39 TRINITY_DN66363_c0_g1_i1:102-1142(-)